MTVSQLIRELKRLVCRHEWKVSRFVALGCVNPDYKCNKCGKWMAADD